MSALLTKKPLPLHPNWHDVMYASSHKKKKEAKKKNKKC